MRLISTHAQKRNALPVHCCKVRFNFLCFWAFLDSYGSCWCHVGPCWLHVGPRSLKIAKDGLKLRQLGPTWRQIVPR